MNHTDQFYKVAYLVKYASPAWAKMWHKLGPAARERLVNSLPKGKSRVVGKSIGEGLEGRIYPSVTGGRGETATKTFFDRPAVNSQGLPDDAMKIFTGGDKGVKHTLGDYNISERADLMKHFSDYFPKIYGKNPRGYTMERLQHMTGDTSVMHGTRDLIKDFTGVSKGTKKMIPGLSNKYIFGAGNPSIPHANISQARQGLANSNDMIRQLMPQRNKSVASHLHPMNQLESRLNKRTGTNPITGGDGQRGTLQLPYKGDMVAFKDFGYMPEPTMRSSAHNMMQTAQGRGVISDAIPYRMQPSSMSPAERLRSIMFPSKAPSPVNTRPMINTNTAAL